MPTASFRFIGILNDFLDRRRKGTEFRLRFEPHQSVKHQIESLGIPHTEVGSILVNKKPVGPKYLPKEGDYIEVHPADHSALENHNLRFVLDNHLGRLAAYLRLLGYDTLYRNDFQDEELAKIASQESRILLTRDRHLLMRNAVERGYCLRSLDPHEQFHELVKVFGLEEKEDAFKRCLRCNTLLVPVAKADVLDRLEPLTRLYYDEFHLCPSCDQVYWKGSHFTKMLELVGEATGKTVAEVEQAAFHRGNADHQQQGGDHPEN